MMGYKNRSCLRTYLKGYRPVRTSKSAPKLANGQALRQFQTLRGFKLLQGRDYYRFLTCLLACSPRTSCGSSCEINSIYFLIKQLPQSRNVESIGPTASIQVPMGKLSKRANAASHLSRWQRAHSQSLQYKKRSCSRNDLKRYNPNMYLTIALKAAETDAIALQRPERLGIDLIEDGTGTLVGKTGGAYDVNSMAYVGGGYEYRKYTMGTMTLLEINLLGNGKNTVRTHYRTRSCSRNILKGCSVKRYINIARRAAEKATIGLHVGYLHTVSGLYPTWRAPNSFDGITTALATRYIPGPFGGDVSERLSVCLGAALTEASTAQQEATKYIAGCVLNTSAMVLFSTQEHLSAACTTMRRQRSQRKALHGTH
jgi:hypothetical protein